MSNKLVRFRPHVGHASGRREGWVKHVTAVDVSKTNGYAFDGEFLKAGVETELPRGSILLHVDPAGSVKNGWKHATVCRLEADGEETELTENVLDWRDDFLSIRDAVVNALESGDREEFDSPFNGFSDTEILDEAKRRGLI